MIGLESPALPNTTAARARPRGSVQPWLSPEGQPGGGVLSRLPHARSNVDLTGVGAVIESLFWRLLALAMSGSEIERDRWIDTATQVTYHALFRDPSRRAARWTRKPTRPRR